MAYCRAIFNLKNNEFAPFLPAKEAYGYYLMAHPKNESKMTEKERFMQKIALGRLETFKRREIAKVKTIEERAIIQAQEDAEDAEILRQKLEAEAKKAEEKFKKAELEKEKEEQRQMAIEEENMRRYLLQKKKLMEHRKKLADDYLHSLRFPIVAREDLDT
eukprot:Platyproteum_vivax@DN1902_c0_g1_i1.p1